jgi:drug/metabolite transporter (DMT)-like permease
MIQGFLLLLAAALSFALSTAGAKLVALHSAIPAVEITFFRFITGFIIMVVYVGVTGKTIIPVNLKYITARALFNTAAVIFLFIAIEHTTVSKVNILNMTYPVFVFMVSPFITGEAVRTRHLLYLALTAAGIFLIVVPGHDIESFRSINRGDLFALMSGVCAAFAVTLLRQARKYDDSYIILLYLMGIGTAINLFFVVPVFVLPRGMEILYLAGTTLAALSGQLFITVGYKYISATAGSLVSSSQILWAVLIGIAFFGDTMTLRIGGGILCIVLSLGGVSGVGRKKPQYGTDDVPRIP